MKALDLKYQPVKTKDRILILLVLITTTNPFWTDNKFVQLFFLIVLIVNTINIRGFLPIEKPIVIMFFIYTLLTLLQGIKWGFSLFTFITHFSLVYIYSYFLFQSYGKDIYIYLEQILWKYTILVLAIYFIHEFVPQTADYMKSLIEKLSRFSSDVEHHSRSIMFYTFRDDTMMSFGLRRNAGFAHEPGAFALFTNLAIIINYIRGIPLFSKRNLVYVLALITTFSTAGYLSFFILILLLVKSKRNIIISFSFFIIILFFSFRVYNESSFMRSKIEQRFESQTEKSLSGKTVGRIYGMRKSLYVLSQHPLHGRGLLQMTMPESKYDPEYASYGWLSYVSKLGLLTGCFFLYFYLRGIYNMVTFEGFDTFTFLIISMSLFINLTAQAYITDPLFLYILYIGIYNRQKPFINTNYNEK